VIEQVGIDCVNERIEHKPSKEGKLTMTAEDETVESGTSGCRKKISVIESGLVEYR